VAPRKPLCEIQGGSQEMAVMVLKPKILIMTIQVNLVANPSETWRRQHKFTGIVIIEKICHWHHSHFLTTTLDFTSQ